MYSRYDQVFYADGVFGWVFRIEDMTVLKRLLENCDRLDDYVLSQASDSMFETSRSGHEDDFALSKAMSPRQRHADN